MGVEPGSTSGTRSSAGIMLGTHVLNPDKNAIKERDALLKNAQ
jgi:hypothetical protein